MSVRVVLESFATWEGVLVVDDTGKKRAKVTKRIPYVHDFKNQAGTDSIRGQEIVLLVFITPCVTIPVAFAFYQPDPAYSEWAKQDKRFKRPGVAKSKRPRAPVPNTRYPNNQQRALERLAQFALEHPQCG